MAQIVPILADQGLIYSKAVGQLTDEDGHPLHHSLRDDGPRWDAFPYYGEVLSASMLGADPSRDPAMERDRKTWISGYKIVWMLVMFDLPVVETEERKAATRFRNFLLDQGFVMAQFSVYYRILPGKDAALALERKIEYAIPEHGSVNILSITDKQYETMRVFQGKRRENPKKTQQLTLF